MAILGPHGLKLHSPFTDALSVTVPFEHSDELQASCRPLLSELGASECSGGYWKVPPLSALPDGRIVSQAGHREGGVLFKRYGPVLQAQTSGSALRSMRTVGLADHWLSVFGSFPHRITRLDATVDLQRPAGPLVMALHAHTSAHGLRLGRKLTPPSNCRSLLRTSHYEPTVPTGTVYIGNRGSSGITGTVYDKRNEVLDRGGWDPGDLLRVEISFDKDVGCSLRDAARPGPLFWTYAGQLLAPPADFTPWQRGPDLSFELEKLPPLDPVVRITRACERNEGLRTVIYFSDDLGIERRHLWGYMNHAHPVRGQL